MRVIINCTLECEEALTAEELEKFNNTDFSIEVIKQAERQLRQNGEFDKATIHSMRLLDEEKEVLLIEGK